MAALKSLITTIITVHVPGNGKKVHDGEHPASITEPSIMYDNTAVASESGLGQPADNSRTGPLYSTFSTIILEGAVRILYRVVCKEFTRAIDIEYRGSQ
jgi:hypothetical protein